MGRPWWTYRNIKKWRSFVVRASLPFPSITSTELQASQIQILPQLLSPKLLPSSVSVSHILFYFTSIILECRNEASAQSEFNIALLQNSIDEQKKVASVLKSIDYSLSRLITLAANQNEKLDTMNNSLGKLDLLDTINDSLVLDRHVCGSSR